jgi:hypothetical protein
VILAHPGASARASAAQSAHQRGRRRGTAPWREPTRQREEEGLTARSGRRRGEVDQGSATGEIPRRFSAVGLVLWRGSGGEARAVVGGHGGGVNLTDGDLGWPVHGVVAGARGGEVAGEAAGRNRR